MTTIQHEQAIMRITAVDSSFSVGSTGSGVWIFELI